MTTRDLTHAQRAALLERLDRDLAYYLRLRYRIDALRRPAVDLAYVAVVAAVAASGALHRR